MACRALPSPLHLGPAFIADISSIALVRLVNIRQLIKIVRELLICIINFFQEDHSLLSVISFQQISQSTLFLGA
jgi:hypothetical protein